MREIMKNLWVVVRTFWIVIASIVTIVLIGREIAWEMRPTVKPNLPAIKSDFSNAIAAYADDSQSYQIDITGDSDLLRVFKPALGVTPELSVTVSGAIEITAPADQLSGNMDALEAFSTLCDAASYVRNMRDSSDFRKWTQEFILSEFDAEDTPMHRDALFKAIADNKNGVVVITIIP